MDEQTVKDMQTLNSLGLEPLRRKYLVVKLLRAADADARAQIIADAREELQRNRSRTQAEYSRKFAESKAYAARRPKK